MLGISIDDQIPGVLKKTVDTVREIPPDLSHPGIVGMSRKPGNLNPPSLQLLVAGVG